MGVLDFLFEGQPPPTQANYGQTVTDMPKWLSDYTRGIISSGAAVAGEPYQAYEGPRLAGLTPDQLRSFDITRGASGAYAPLTNAASNTAQGALTQVKPYFDAAAKTTPEAISEYMNPYVSNVIDYAGTLANRQLNEKFLPSVQNVFGAAGQDARSTQMRRTVDQGVRDLTEGLHEQSLGALSQAYQQAGSQFSTDASRLGQLGTNLGNLSLDTARTEGDLATNQQNLALRDAAAVNAIGQEQQQDTQRSLDLAYQDFQNQRDYPRSGLDWLSNLIQGTPSGRATTTASTGPASSVSPSGLQQIGSVATGVAGLLDLLKKKTPESPTTASGSARGGRVGYRRGGLRYAYAA